MSSAESTPYLHSRLLKNTGSNKDKKLKTSLTSPIKRSMTENLSANKKRSKQIHNQQSQSQSKDKESRALNPFQRHLSLNTVIKFKNSSEIQKNLINQPNVNQLPSEGAQTYEEPNKKQKLLEKIPDHRRIRSTSKISTKIIEISDFFNANSKVKVKQRVKSQFMPPEQNEENLEKLLQIKLKTQIHSKNQNSGDLISFRNTLDSVQFTSKNNYGLHIPLKTKLSDILTKKQINDSKQIIKQNEEMRMSKNLRPNPKQWQFHNCLVLQRIELYATNLKISCQGWVALDHLELKYLRGWNPKIEDDFSPLIRLFIAKIGLDLPVIAKFGLNIDKIFIRVNDKHIYEDEAAKRKDNSQKLKGLAPNTILSLKQLITISTITKHHDLIVHSVLAIGSLLQLIHTQHETNQMKDPLSSIRDGEVYHLFIKTTDLNKLQEYCSYFEKQCERICEDLDLPNTRVFVDFSCLHKYFKKKVKNTRNQVNEFNVVSTSLDIAVLFMKCLGEKDFRQILSYRAYEGEIKFQVGWNFWETRTQKWLNSQFSKYHLKAVGGRNNKGNQSYVVWDDYRDIVISMADCKVNMHWKDTERIQHWIENHISRFSKQYSLHMTFYPTDTEKFHKIN